jgi:hypothetical protein
LQKWMRLYSLHPRTHRILSQTLVGCDRRYDPKKVSLKTRKKLCIIVLFHALFNMMNKRVAKHAMTQATKLKEIPSEAYAKTRLPSSGLRIEQSPHVDILRQHHTPAALCSNDAKQCYNRIVHSVAKMCLYKGSG